jgi:hypothetical protein
VQVQELKAERNLEMDTAIPRCDGEEEGEDGGDVGEGGDEGGGGVAQGDEDHVLPQSCPASPSIITSPVVVSFMVVVSEESNHIQTASSIGGNE